MINKLELVALAREAGIEYVHFRRDNKASFDRFCDALITMTETRMKVILQEAEESRSDALDNLWVVLKFRQGVVEVVGTFYSKPNWHDLGELKGVPDTLSLAGLKNLGRCETVQIGGNTSMVLIKAKKAEVALEETKSTD